MRAAPQFAIVGSVCLHGVALALAMRAPAGGGSEGGAVGDAASFASVELVTESSMEQSGVRLPTAAPPTPDPPAVEAAIAPPEAVRFGIPPVSAPRPASLPPAATIPPEFSAAHSDPGRGEGRGSGRVVGGGAGDGGGRLCPVRYRRNPAPAYPASALREHREGVVLLLVKVSAEGRPTSVEVRRGSGTRLLDEAAVRAVRRWRFDPARMGGKSVASDVEVPVRFEFPR